MKKIPNKYFRFIIVLSAISLFTFFYFLLYNSPIAGVDDANIFFKFAHNLSSGLGFSFNPDGERVEGFTSFLWLLIITCLYKLPKEEIILIVFNTFLLSFSINYAVDFIDNHFTMDEKSGRILSIESILFISVCCFSPGFILWSNLSLMESGLWASLLLIIAILTLKIIYYSKYYLVFFSFLIFLIAITRPEGILICTFFGVLYLIITRKINEFQKWKSIIPLVVTLISIISLTIFRYFYFGYPLPNTYYAKVSYDMLYNLENGIEYFLKFVYNNILIYLTIISIIFIFYKSVRIRTNPNKSTRIQLIISFISLCLFMVPILEGGDHFDFQRLYIVYLPIFLLNIFNSKNWNEYLTIKIKANVIRKKYILLIILLPLLLLLQRHNFIEIMNNSKPMYIDFFYANEGRKIGTGLNSFFQFSGKYPSIGTIAIGGFGYTYKGNIIDLVGLENVEMAHFKRESRPKGIQGHSAFSKVVLFNQKPSLVLGNFTDSTSFMNFAKIPGNFSDNLLFETKVLKNVFDDIEFRKLYAPVIIKHPYKNIYFETFIERDYAKQIEKCGYIIHWKNPS